MNTMGKRLQATRLDKDLQQKEVSKITGIHEKQLSRYENDKVQPSAEVLAKLCWLYQVSADYILGLPKGLEWPR